MRESGHFLMPRYDSDVHREWINTLSDMSLNEWETSLVENLQQMVTVGLPISSRQEEVLEKLYIEKTS